jgi:enterochelin esterase-like enzyme
MGHFTVNWSARTSVIIFICRLIIKRAVKDTWLHITSSDNGYLDKELPIESIIITELIPFIDGHYRTLTDRDNRALSGFSMGGAAAFYYAVNYYGLFC